MADGFHSLVAVPADRARLFRVTEQVKRASRPIVLFCNALGDHLLIRPTLIALADIFDGRLSFLGCVGAASKFYPDINFASSRTMAFYQGDDGRHDFDMEDLDAIMESHDALISLNWWDSPLLRSLESHIDPKPFLSLTCTHGMFGQIAADQHMADYCFQIATALDPARKIADYVSLPHCEPLTNARARQIKQLIPPSSRILAVHTLTRVDKRWGQGNWRDLLSRFLASHPEYSVLVLDPTDQGLELPEFADRMAILDGVDLLTATELLRGCDLFVGIDSYFLHAADFAGIPAVAVFGSTNHRCWGVRFAAAAHHCSNPTPSVPVLDVLESLNRFFELVEQRSNEGCSSDAYPNQAAI